MMKTIKRLIVGILMLTLMVGCKTSKPSAPTINTVPIQRETETKYIHSERIDTLYINIPAQTAERTTAERESHLETEYALSDARINDNGTLSHTLRNKTGGKPVPVKVTSDTILRNVYVEKPYPVEIPKEVVAPLTWWQRTRLNTWGPMASAIFICLSWIFRKPLCAFARRLI